MDGEAERRGFEDMGAVSGKGGREVKREVRRAVGVGSAGILVAWLGGVGL